MTASALIVLILAILVLWGGLAASLVALRMSPERVTYPPGGEDDDRDESAVIRPDFHRWWGVGWCLCRSGVRGVGVRGTSLAGILTMWPRSSVV